MNSQNNFYVICILNLVLILLLAWFLIKPKVTEMFLLQEMFSPQEQAEAIATVAGLYNSGDFKVTNMTVTDKFSLLPDGVIVAWSGANIPDGWIICDGTNNTPDLRGRFILGYGSGRGGQMNGKGGAEQVTLNVSQIPAHSHRVCGDFVGYSRHHDAGDDEAFPNYYSHACVNSDNTGGGQAHENMPPYWVLAYIMRKAGATSGATITSTPQTGGAKSVIVAQTGGGSSVIVAQNEGTEPTTVNVADTQKQGLMKRLSRLF